LPERDIQALSQVIRGGIPDGSGERLTGSQEVSGSIPLISTTKNLEAAMVSRFFHVYGKLHKAVFVLNLC